MKLLNFTTRKALENHLKKVPNDKHIRVTLINKQYTLEIGE